MEWTKTWYSRNTFVSFDASVKWAYYADQMREAHSQWRISNAPHEPALKVHTAWDLGINDTTNIWFFQIYWKEVRIMTTTKCQEKVSLIMSMC